VVYLDWIGGRRSVSRVADGEQKTGLALESRDHLAVRTKHPVHDQDEVTPVICPTYAIHADMRSAVTNSTRVVFAVVKGSQAALYDLMPIEICRTEKGDAKEFPLLAQNGDLRKFRTRLRDYGNRTTTPAVWRIVHDPSIVQHQAQPRSYLPAPACHWRIHPAVPPYHPKLTQRLSHDRGISIFIHFRSATNISVWHHVPIQRLHHLTAG
jgi:hypothetical protein